MELFDAIQAGDAAAVRKVAMSSPQLLKETNTRGELPLLVAAESGDAALVEALLDAGVDPDCRSEASDGQTALLSAVWGADDVMLQTLLKGDADPNAADLRKRTAVHACALIGNRVLLEFLCDPAGFDSDAFADAPPLDLSLVSSQDCDGMTPLHYACAEVAAAAHVAGVLEFLLREAPAKAIKAALAKRSSSGRTPLHCLAGALAASQETPRVLDLLKKLVVAAGKGAMGAAALLAAKDEDGMTPLHIAALGGAPQVFVALAKAVATSTSDAAAAKAIFATTASCDGRTLLHAIASQDTVTVVSDMLKAVPSDVRNELWPMKDATGRSCADLAVRAGTLDALVAAGAPETLVTAAKADAATKDTKADASPAKAGGMASNSAKKVKSAKGDFSGAGHEAVTASGESRFRMAMLAFAVFATVTLPLLHTVLADQGWL